MRYAKTRENSITMHLHAFMPVNFYKRMERIRKNERASKATLVVVMASFERLLDYFKAIY